MKFLRNFVVIVVVFLAPFAYAQVEQGTTQNSQPETQGTTQNSVQQPTSIKLVNPLGTTKTLPEFVEGILRIVLTIGVPLVALAIIYAGFKFVMAQGKPNELEEARRTLLYVLIGAGILLAAYVIAESIVGTINAIRG